jgi:phosphopantetheinyl transferase
MKVAGITQTSVETLRDSGTHRWLSDEESQRLLSTDPHAASDWLAGRIALKQAYMDFAGWDPRSPTALNVRNGVIGYPQIGDCLDVYCSLSHSDGWGIGAVAFAPVGVDIERIRQRDAAILRHIAHDEEIAAFDDELNTLVTHVWTIKESAMKAWRKGLGISPKSVVLRRLSKDCFSVCCTTVELLLPVVTVSVDRVDDFVIAVASTEEGHETGNIRWVDMPGVPAPI